MFVFYIHLNYNKFCKYISIGAFFDRFAYATFLNDPNIVYEATQFSYDGEGLTFGLLISDFSVNAFIGDYINDHAMAFDLCAEEVFQRIVVSPFFFLVLLVPFIFSQLSYESN